MWGSTRTMMVDKQMVPEDDQQMELLTGIYDNYGGVSIEINNPMNSNVFGDLLRASISQWKQKVLYYCSISLFLLLQSYDAYIMNSLWNLKIYV